MKRTFSIKVVIFIFLFVYLLEIAIGYYFVHTLIINKIFSIRAENQLRAKKIEAFDTYTASIRKLHEEKKYDEASREAEKALKVSTAKEEKAYIYYWLALITLDKGDYAKSEQYANTSVSLNAKYPYTYDILFKINLDQHNYNEALENANKLINSLPNKSVGYNNAGIAYEYLGKTDEALAKYTKAAGLSPNDKVIQDNLISYKEKLKNPKAYLNYTGSEETFWQNEVSYIRQDLSKTQTYKGNSSYDQGKVNEALNLLQQKLSIAERISNKMKAKTWLTAQDETDIKNYQEIQKRYIPLAESL